MDHPPKKLRVLISAYACEPGRGSEPGVGWNVVRELSSRFSLRVITRANNRTTIEKSGEPWVTDVQWIFWDPPQWLIFWKKGGRGVQLFYIIWQWGVKAVAARALADQDADVIHHLTFGKYWIPSRLAGLGRPFVFGPVGGGESSPPGLTASNLLKRKFPENLKNLMTWSIGHFPPAVRLLRSAAWTFATTPQTESVLRKLGVTQVSVLPQSGIRPSDLPRGISAEMHAKKADEEFVLISASRLIHWKAIDLAIEAVAVAAQQIPLRLIILQNGPEMAKLKQLAKNLGISNLVDFKGKLPQLDDVYREIANADALIHPALHEAFGQACLESLALGVPVICLDWAGPGLIVNESCGIRVRPGSREQTVDRLVVAILQLARLIAENDFGKEPCQSRAYNGFSWSRMANEISACYKVVNSVRMASSDRNESSFQNNS
jgi:glycosyltransferase involved in cell wall biosynthesis